MLIEYYKNEKLAYSNRKRYRNISISPDSTEIQKSIMINNGATCSIKTSKENICNYVIIDNTRWYVVSYIYLNGGQVELNLQRDVIGEFGINECVGKIERGYTNSILKYRKELSLNEILKKRIKLIPDNFKYGNYSVNTHTDELWGVLYFVRPTGIDPNTGEEYPEQVNINIPAFSPEVIDLPVFEDGKKFFAGLSSSGVTQSFNIAIEETLGFSGQHIEASVIIRYDYSNNNWYASEIDINNVRIVDGALVSDVNEYVLFSVSVFPEGYNLDYANNLVNAIVKEIGNRVVNSNYNSIIFPVIPDYEDDIIGQNDFVVKDENNNFYAYTSEFEIEIISGTVSDTGFYNTISSMNGIEISYTFNNVERKVNISSSISSISDLVLNQSSGADVSIRTVHRTELTPQEAGNIVINTNQQLVDEPYSILVFPLYNCTISGNAKTYNIQKNVAFNVFNTVIQYLSGGSNPYLIDAQIYPYCPYLVNVASEINNYPFFSILSNNYVHTCSVQLLPLSDVKKEYIEKTYSIISPEKSGKFDFNFYDYCNVIEDNDGVNYSFLYIDIKTALKPFAIISSAVIRPYIDSLKGITYDSDLRGSQPSSNGFECSLSSNAFQTYVRENSNYQQIFALQKDELKINQETERTNEKVSSIVNTISSAAMGAIGGAALGGGGWTGIAGAVAGGAAAGAVVGSAMKVQYDTNEKLREYEAYLQQQNFDLQISTVKNLPNSINRISSFNEIILKDFWYVIEIYECSDYEKIIVDKYIEKFSYSIGVIDYIYNYTKEGWFIRSTLISSPLIPILHTIAQKELNGGIYYHEQV